MIMDNKRRTKYNRNSTYSYVGGNTVYNPDTEREDDIQHFRSVRGRKRVHERRAAVRRILFMCSMVVAIAGVLAWYVSLRSSITGSVKQISVLESQLNDLKQANDEKYNKASSNVDLDEIKRIAVEDYGMQYAGNDQIVSYSDEGGDDYVRQNSEIPHK
jgi:hypothetical protein